MKLLVKDAARLLDVSEKTIYRWIKQGSIPAYRLNEQYRFNRAELLEWATARRIAVSPEIFREEESETASLPRFAEALRAGGIHYRIGGTDKASVLHHVVETMRLPEEVDREFLFEVLLAREALGSTAIGDGIAIPHVRNPVILHLERPMITLCFLEQAVDFGALDGRPVDTLFTLISPTVRAHLHLLSRLSFALRDRAFKEAILGQAAREEILAAGESTERSPGPPVPAAR
ncbi:MAG: helix-turn-helix domain-containing protein [Thermoanaerobaculia bacterium]|nr:MAG: helix-turn-helix domain-containing protein [Thermoanaerobaculia bacterium]